MFKRYVVFFLLTTVICGCKPEAPDLKDYLDGWAYATTFRIYPSCSITVIGKRAKIVSGDNSVLVVESNKLPIYKPNVSELTDLHSIRSLYVELDTRDSLINPAQLGHSRIIREIIAMSPRYGVNDLDPEEKLEIKKLSFNRWKVNSDLEDFRFEGEFSFADSSTITSKQVELYDNQK